MASNTLSVDPRAINPLACAAEQGLDKFPRDSIHRVACTLNLFAQLIGNYNGQCELFSSDDYRFALSLQFEGMASLLDAVADDLIPRKPAIGSNEVIVELAEDELAKLTILAARKQQSIHDTIQSIVIESLRAFDPGRQNKGGAQ
jgi:hypothetical protein